VFEGFVLDEIAQVITCTFVRGETHRIVNRRFYGLALCTEGQMTYRHNGKTYVATPGHATILPQGETYTLHCDRAGAFPVINFTCVHFAQQGFAILPIANAAALVNDYEQIRKLFVFERSRLRVRSLFYGMLDRLPQAQDEAFSTLGPAVRYLEEHLSDPGLTNAQLSQAAGVSEVYFRQLFQRQYGVTPRQYILNVRMQKARQLLSGGHDAVSDIAEACGFASVYHFCRSFRERTGLTPSQYRQANRQQVL